MNIEEELIESHKALSKIMATLLTVIMVISVYVVQRSLFVIWESPDLLESIILKGSRQIGFCELKFSYRTMMVMWPLIIGLLCLVYTLLENKRIRIENSLKEGALNKQNNIANLDPFHISASLFQSNIARLIVSVFAIIPLLATVCHFLMVLLWATSLGWNAQILTIYSEYFKDIFPPIAKGTVFSITSTLFSIFGFFGALLFWKTIKKRIRT